MRASDHGDERGLRDLRQPDQYRCLGGLGVIQMLAEVAQGAGRHEILGTVVGVVAVQVERFMSSRGPQATEPAGLWIIRGDELRTERSPSP